jgi:hypothetical protein
VVAGGRVVGGAVVVVDGVPSGCLQ